MSGRSPLTRRAALAALLLFPAAMASANDGHADYLLAYRSNATTHGLYEIREAGANFLDRERPKRAPQISVLDPDIRIVVSRCAVPLKAHWGREPLPFAREAVIVVCSRTNTKYEPSWDILLPLFDPAADAKWRNGQKQKKVADVQKKQGER
jgi:hypothetical protein